jgi:hypothetical protein
MLRATTVLVCALLLSGCEGEPSPQAKRVATANKSASWDQYVADLKPNLEGGFTGMGIDPKFWVKYGGMAVEWTGIMKSCTKVKDDKVSCDVIMPAHTVKLPDGPPSGTVIDTITVTPDPADAPRWQAVPAGTEMRFNARTLATVMVLPPRKPQDSPIVAIPLNEGRLSEKK